MTNDNFEVAMTRCFLCGGDKDIVMNTKFTKKMANQIKDMHGKVTNLIPCPECKKHMESNIILIGIDEEKSDRSLGVEGAYRTGEFMVVSESLVKQLIKEPAVQSVLKTRVAFIPQELAKEVIASFEEFKRNNPDSFKLDDGE